MNDPWNNNEYNNEKNTNLFIKVFIFINLVVN